MLAESSMSKASVLLIRLSCSQVKADIIKASTSVDSLEFGIV